MNNKAAKGQSWDGEFFHVRWREEALGFEIFFARSEAEFAKPSGPDMPRLVAIAAEHGIHFVQP